MMQSEMLSDTEIETILHRYLRYVQSFVRTVIHEKYGQSVDEQELISAGMMQAWQSMKKYREGHGSLYDYVMPLVRAKVRYAAHHLYRDNVRGSETISELRTTTDRSCGDCQGSVQIRDVAAKINHLLHESMNDEDRMVFEEVFIAGQSTATIARKLSITHQGATHRVANVLERARHLVANNVELSKMDENGTLQPFKGKAPRRRLGGHTLNGYKLVDRRD